MDKNEKIFAAVDIGSTKIVALAGRKNDDGKIEIIGLGHSASRGVTRGVVVNVEETFAAISDAVGQAENDCGYYINDVFVNISGQHLVTLTTKQQKILGNDPVTESEVAQMMEQAKNVNLDHDMFIYHVNHESYTIDGEPVPNGVVGAIGKKLEGTYKIHVAPNSYQRNIAKCFDGGAIQVRKAILDPIASSEVVLLEEEKEAGVALVDIGGGTTKISVFYDGVLCFTSMVPFGGNVITKDIREGCSITAKDAESMKLQFGQAIADFAPENKVVTIQRNGWEPKQMSFKSLAHIIQARMEEIVMYVFQLIHRSGYADKLGAGIVITGGTSLLPNLSQLIKFKTGFDVRIGKPNLNGFVPRKEVYDPRFATALGLLSMAALEGDTDKRKKRRRKEKAEPSGPGILEAVKVKISQGKGKIGQIVIGFFEDNPDDTEMS